MEAAGSASRPRRGTQHVVAQVLAAERCARVERDVPADDAVPPEEAVLGVEPVHRAAEPARDARVLAEELVPGMRAWPWWRYVVMT